MSQQNSTPKPPSKIQLLGTNKENSNSLTNSEHTLQNFIILKSSRSHRNSDDNTIEVPSSDFQESNIRNSQQNPLTTPPMTPTNVSTASSTPYPSQLPQMCPHMVTHAQHDQQSPNNRTLSTPPPHTHIEHHNDSQLTLSTTGVKRAKIFQPEITEDTGNTGISQIDQHLNETTTTAATVHPTHDYINTNPMQFVQLCSSPHVSPLRRNSQHITTSTLSQDTIQTIDRQHKSGRREQSPLPLSENRISILCDDSAASKTPFTTTQATTVDPLLTTITPSSHANNSIFAQINAMLPHNYKSMDTRQLISLLSVSLRNIPFFASKQHNTNSIEENNTSINDTIDKPQTVKEIHHPRCFSNINELNDTSDDDLMNMVPNISHDNNDNVSPTILSRFKTLQDELELIAIKLSKLSERNSKVNQQNKQLTHDLVKAEQAAEKAQQQSLYWQTKYTRAQDELTAIKDHNEKRRERERVFAQNTLINAAARPTGRGHRIKEISLEAKIQSQPPQKHTGLFHNGPVIRHEMGELEEYDLSDDEMEILEQSNSILQTSFRSTEWVDFDSWGVQLAFHPNVEERSRQLGVTGQPKVIQRPILVDTGQHTALLNAYEKLQREHTKLLQEIDKLSKRGIIVGKKR